jgi:hypothetical protein
MAAAKKKRAATGRKKKATASGRSRAKATVEKEIGDMLTQLVRAQVKVVNHFGKFAADTATLSLAGVVSPTTWVDRYAKMWKDLTTELAKKS